MSSISERIFKILQEKYEEIPSSDDDCELPYECHLCAAIYFLKNEFYAHVESHNKKKKNVYNEKLFPCTFEGCSKIFSRNSDMLKHLVKYIIFFLKKLLIKILFLAHS